MSLSFLVTVVVMGGVVYFGYKVMKKAWHRADVEDAIDEVNMTSEESKVAKVVDLEAHQQEKERVEQLLNLKGKNQ